MSAIFREASGSLRGTLLRVGGFLDLDMIEVYANMGVRMSHFFAFLDISRAHSRMALTGWDSLQCYFGAACVWCI